MVGLALGAALVQSPKSKVQSPKCEVRNCTREVRSQGSVSQVCPSDFGLRAHHPLMWLAFGLAGYALLLPLVLPLLNRLGGSDLSLLLLKGAIGALTLILAGLVGMQFPLANRPEDDSAGAGASQLYTADFMGAFLGALLTCTLLIPLVGVLGTCLTAAGVNVLAGLAMIRARAR
jgi:hypothetical protein